MTMVGTALVGAVLMLSLMFVPGVRDPERSDYAQRMRDDDERAATSAAATD